MKQHTEMLLHDSQSISNRWWIYVLSNIVLLATLYFFNHVELGPRTFDMLSIYSNISLVLFAVWMIPWRVLKNYLLWVPIPEKEKKTFPLATHKTYSILSTFYLSIAYMIFSIMVYSLLTYFQAIPKDPQGLSNLTISQDAALANVLHTPFIGLGEEAWRFSGLLVIFLLLQLVGKKWKMPLLVQAWLAIVLSSFLFGLLHVPAWGWDVVIGHSLTSMIEMYLVIKFRSLIPAIIGHALLDAVNYLSLMEGIPLDLRGMLFLFATLMVLIPVTLEIVKIIGRVKEIHRERKIHHE